MSTLAVFIALGGSSYAALRISGSDIQNRSIPAKKLKRNAITGKEVRESRLNRVPRARHADRLGGFSAAELRIRCPGDTFPIADVCVERTPRAGIRHTGAPSSSASRSARRRARAGDCPPTASSRAALARGPACPRR